MMVCYAGGSGDAAKPLGVPACSQASAGRHWHPAWPLNKRSWTSQQPISAHVQVYAHLPSKSSVICIGICIGTACMQHNWAFAVLPTCSPFTARGTKAVQQQQQQRQHGSPCMEASTELACAYCTLWVCVGSFCAWWLHNLHLCVSTHCTIPQSWRA